jgi:hypothetical protein
VRRFITLYSLPNIIRMKSRKKRPRSKGLQSHRESEREDEMGRAYRTHGKKLNAYSALDLDLGRKIILK